MLDNASLDSYSNQLASLGSSLAETGDILLYGCNVAEGEQGQQLVATLAQLTGADVAASSDLTGAASQGGDWTLEISSGEVTSAALSATDYTQTLDVITGGEGDDIQLGTDYADDLDGGVGHDTLDGGAGDDNLYGNFGNFGNDSLQAQSLGGVQTLVGGNGNDTYYVDNASDVVTESSDATNGGIDAIIASVSRTLGDYQEHLTLAGTSAINGTGNSLAITLTGNGAANVLTGGAGNDTLLGGAGNDRVVGGIGKDIMSGGTGNDIFDFNALSEMGTTSTTWDVISDFIRGQNKIDLSTLDANTATTATNEAFTSVIASAHHLSAGLQR